MSSKPVEHNGHPEETAVVKSVTPNGRILYAATSVLQSEAARRYLHALTRMTERGLIRKPAPAK